ncbi:MAG: aminotransferase class I/II-fold pyridoxal phosphate-dependent enzyme [Lactobacillales bacterium]|jgi:histidinol-phosphate aminotransferase|nr:aminotransferase class I/II-fold pyridoxal phosphate-dependent enzyme [Lactobacillales bacterium]
MKGIRKISPYVPGEQPNYPDMIKINTNENAYPPSPRVLELLAGFGKSVDLRRYSSLDQGNLRSALSHKYGLKPDNFIVGNGSDEILAFAFLSFFNSSEPVLFPDITYGFYKVWCDLFKIPFEEIALAEDFSISLEDYARPNGGIIIANPNAPTSLYHSADAMKDFLVEHSDSIVIVDEAYVNFGGVSLAPLVNDFDNLVVIHTLSKSESLAGLRVGYAVANPALIEVLGAVKSSFNPYSVDSLAEKLATIAVEDAGYYEAINFNIIKTREEFRASLAELGFETLESKTNFVLTTHPQYDMNALFESLQKDHIFVRHFDKPERLNNYLRITIGTDEEMQKVIENIKKTIS